MPSTLATLCDRAWTRYGGWLVDMLSHAIALEGSFDRPRPHSRVRPARDTELTVVPPRPQKE
jgi:hypothetical protein